MSAQTLDKTFDPAAIEARIYEAWERTGAFACDPGSARPPFSIMMPPPNVTGTLHIGHALTFTIEDILTRHARARGLDALWQPGTDHAGIATQMVVERQMAAEGPNQDRRSMGRAAFLERLWRWKEESGGTIVRQLRRLGASPDWARERFTLDEGMSRAVREVFVRLHEQGLIYRDKRLVNWDPKLQTAVSDLEVEQRQVKGTLWHLRYPVEGAEGDYLVVATTRPETLFGDTAVAVHPEDDRFRHLIGRQLRLPLTDRLIPVVADEHSDPEKGSGAVKITPAHDFNDFAVAKRHGLPMLVIMDADARLIDPVPAPFRGLDRFEARQRVVVALEEAGLLEKAEPHTHMVPHGDRSGVVLEPRLTLQWFCDAETLAKPAIEAVETGRIRFVPEQWAATYFSWMRNIQPWCVSRQLWWGHQIPAWYDGAGHVFVARDAAEAAAQARANHGRDVELTQDEDVLDTWFSSALFPFSTLGWPDKTPELARYYPTDVLDTGFDIIFFWVARMIMMGLHFMGDVPFRTVYIHALVRDAQGQKMSKSKGNVVDPLALVDRYGADALRFTLAALAAPGRDIKLSEPRIEGYRNFATKLWNAARFAEMNGCAHDRGFDPGTARSTLNRWILGEMRSVSADLDADLAAYRFDAAANRLYHFVWGSYCDWYLEFAKPALLGEDADLKAETRATTAFVLKLILLRLHPFMPFLTEELWAHFGFGAGRMLIAETLPDLSSLPGDASAKAEIDWVVALVSETRAARAELNVPAGAQVQASLEADATRQGWFARHRASIERLARIVPAGGATDGIGAAGVVSIGLDGATLSLALGAHIDMAAEARRLSGEIDKLDKELAKLSAKLANADFRAKADPEVIEETEERHQSAQAARDRLKAAVSRLA